MSEHAIQDEALEVADATDDGDGLGDGTKTRGVSWIAPDQEP